MDSHKVSALNRLEVVETGRRRRWSDEEKERIILESMAGPRLVAATARRHGMSRSLLATWRRTFGIDPDGVAGFVPAMIAPVESDSVEPPALNAVAPDASAQRIEIALSGGRRLFVDAGVDVEALARIVAVLDRR